MDADAQAAQLRLKLAEQRHVYSDIECQRKHLEEQCEQAQAEVVAIKDKLHSTEQDSARAVYI